MPTFATCFSESNVLPNSTLSFVSNYHSFKKLLLFYNFQALMFCVSKVRFLSLEFSIKGGYFLTCRNVRIFSKRPVCGGSFLGFFLGYSLRLFGRLLLFVLDIIPRAMLIWGQLLFGR